MSLQTWADVLSLAGTVILTWPALRAGHVLARAANAATKAAAERDPTGKNIFRRMQIMFASNSWRPADQRWLWTGLAVTIVAGALELVAR